MGQRSPGRQLRFAHRPGSIFLFFPYGLSWPKVSFEIPKMEGGQLLFCAGAIASETISSVTETPSLSTTLE